MVERLSGVSSIESKKIVKPRKYFRNIKQLAAFVLATPHNTPENQYISPERHAFNDWFALQQANTHHRRILAEIEAKKDFGEPEDESLKTDLDGAEGMLSNRMQEYRNHFTVFRKRYPNLKEDPYNNTMLSLEGLYRKRMRAERTKIHSHNPPSYFTESQIEVSAMENVLNDFESTYHRVRGDLSSDKAV